MKIEKQYPNYTLIRDDGKRIKVLYSEKENSYEVIGVSGKKVADGAKALQKTGCIFLEYLVRYTGWKDWKKYLDLYERIISLPGAPANFYLQTYDFDDIKKIPFKKIAKIFRESEEVIFNSDDLKIVLIKSEAKEKLDNKQYEFFTHILNYLNIETRWQIISNQKYRTIFLKVVPTVISEVYGYRETINLINEYFNYCKYLNCSPETGDFFVNYKKTKADYEAARTKADERKFKETQLKYNLYFEDEEFMTIIPTTRKELIDEGRKLKNCLGGYEFENFLKNGRKCVVFIRKKSEPERPYIACDFTSKVLRIQQFLTYNNESVRDIAARRFKEKYQEYLYSLLEKTE